MHEVLRDATVRPYYALSFLAPKTVKFLRLFMIRLFTALKVKESLFSYILRSLFILGNIHNTAMLQNSTLYCTVLLYYIILSYDVRYYCTKISYPLALSIPSQKAPLKSCSRCFGLNPKH